MKNRIVIVSGLQLSNNPRVVKEADALGNAGFDVEVLAAVLAANSAERERLLYDSKPWIYTPVIDNRQQSAIAKIGWAFKRLRTRLWREVYRYTGITHVAQLGYCGPELLRLCRERDADFYSVHTEQALWVGRKLASEGFPVSVDFEDWYSEDLLPKDRTYRPVKLLRECEAFLHQHAKFKTTTSESLAKALQSEFGGERSHVIPNTFCWSERESLDGEIRDRVNSDLLSVFWFSQTLGPQRGLEDLMESTNYLQNPIEIHLRGNCSDDYREKLLSLATENMRDNIYFHGQVPHHELISRIAEHDIGFAGETAYCPSRDLTITNKVLQYLLAGIPQVASETSGQKEVQKLCPNCVRLYRPGDAKTLAKRIEFFADSHNRTRGRNDALEISERSLCWEVTSKQLVSIFREAIENH